jgi:hypothetical protein
MVDPALPGSLQHCPRMRESNFFSSTRLLVPVPASIEQRSFSHRIDSATAD